MTETRDIIIKINDLRNKVEKDCANFMKKFNNKYIESMIEIKLQRKLTTIVTEAWEKIEPEIDQNSIIEIDKNENDKIDNNDICDMIHSVYNNEYDDNYQINNDKIDENQRREIPSNRSALVVNIDKYDNDEMDESDDSKEEKNNSGYLKFPLFAIDVIGHQSLIDSKGNKFEAYDIRSIKLSISNKDPSRISHKLKRYRVIKDVFWKKLEVELKKKKELKQFGSFPPGTMFWTKRDKSFLDERQKLFGDFFQKCCEGKAFEIILNSDEFQYFFGLKDNPLKNADMVLFMKALKKVCKSNDFYAPSIYELNKYETECEKLICAELKNVNYCTASKQLEIINDATKIALFFRNKLKIRISEIVGMGVSNTVYLQWDIIQKQRKLIDNKLDDMIDKNDTKFNYAIDKLVKKLLPLIRKVINNNNDNNL